MVPINALYFYEKELEEQDYTDEELEQIEYENQVNHEIKAYFEDDF